MQQPLQRLRASENQGNVWRSFVVSTTFLILLVALGVFLGVFASNSRLIESELQIRARSHFNNIVLMRRWNARHGGVFVAKVEGVVSNPYLENPDIRSDQGQTYTKKNPALMTREISELAEQAGDYTFHITSLKPINPGNRADENERKALQSFETGAAEMFWKETRGDRTFFRYMAPLFVEEPCLQCHRIQGYEVGDVRGGISVKFDTSDVDSAMKRNGYIVFALFLITCVFVLGAIYFLTMRLNKKLSDALNKIREMAVTDELTTLFNRRFFFEELRAEIDRGKRYGHTVSCIILDLDHFKRVNDEYGHPGGDRVLRGVAEILEANCRAADTVARYGGEEFVGILPETDMEGALRTAEKIRSAIEGTPIALADGKEIRVTASLGVASLPPEKISGSGDDTELTRIADQALYHAKENGRNRVESAGIE